MTAGLRHGELRPLRIGDLDFANLLLDRHRCSLRRRQAGAVTAPALQAPVERVRETDFDRPSCAALQGENPALHSFLTMAKLAGARNQGLV
jgi:hypothetical protein